MFRINLGVFYPRHFLLVALFLPYVLGLGGCAGEGFGRLERSYELGHQFETCQVPEGYRYYYTGPYHRPLAILGLNPDLELVTDYWHEVAMSPDLLCHYIENMSPWEFRRRNYAGYYMLAPDGRRLGVWYSIQDHTVVRPGLGNAIEVYRPDMDIEERANRPFGAGYKLGIP